MFITWILFFISGLMCNIFISDKNGTQDLSIISWLIVLLLSFSVIFELYKKYSSSFRIALFGYFFRVALLYWDINCSDIFLLPNSGYDSGNFHRVALYKSLDIPVREYCKTYTDFLSYVYRMFGNQRIIGQYLNILLGITAIYLAITALERLNINKKHKKTAMYLLWFAPNFAIMNSILLRESVQAFLISASFLLFVNWWNEGKNYYIMGGIILCLVSSMFHSGSIAPAVGYVLCLILYDRKKGKYIFNYKTIIGIIVVIFAVFLLNEMYGDVFFGRFQNTNSVEDLVDVGEARGDSGYNVGISTGNSIIDLLVNTPIRAFYFVFSPMPWDWRGINDMIAFFLSALYYGIGYICVFRKVKRKEISEDKAQILYSTIIMMLSACLVFAWGVSNAGTALRHRDKFISIFVVMVVLALSSQKENYKDEC